MAETNAWETTTTNKEGGDLWKNDFLPTLKELCGVKVSEKNL